MTRESILVTLRKHAPELQSAGLLHLRLFGSAARGEATEESDIDLLAEFDTSKPITLITLSRMQIRLTELLGTQVDLSSSDWMREPIRKRALQEALVAF